MPPSPSLAAGEVFAERFRLVELLGEGRTGPVYIAEPTAGGEPCALKILDSGYVGDAWLKSRFMNEVLSAKRIASANVARTLDAGVDAKSGRPWIATELLAGESLSALIASNGARPLAEFRRLFMGILDAVAAANAARIVHYDLSPDNVHVTPALRPGDPPMAKVREFGIAQFLVSTRRGSKEEPAANPLWMAPEGLETDKPLTPAANVWSLGLLAFYVLTGHPYWKHVQAGETEELLREILTDPLAAASERAGGGVSLPSRFDGWFARCVVRDVGKRFEDAREARATLRVALPPDRPAPPRKPSSPPPRPSPSGTSTLPIAKTATPPRPVATGEMLPLPITKTETLPLPKPPLPVSPAPRPSPPPPPPEPPLPAFPVETAPSAQPEPAAPPASSAPILPALGSLPVLPIGAGRPRSSVLPYVALGVMAAGAAGVVLWIVARSRPPGSAQPSEASVSAPSTASAPSSAETAGTEDVALAASAAPSAAPSASSTESEADAAAVAEETAPEGPSEPAPPGAGPYEIQTALHALNRVFYGDCHVPRRGKLVVTFAPSGSVRVVRITAGSYDDRVSSCIVSRFSAARIPPFAGGDESVRAALLPTP